MKNPAVPVLAFVLTCVAAAANAAPSDELHAAFEKVLAATSFRATVIDLKKGTPLSQMSYVAPDRYRIDTQGHVSLIIGDQMYMDLGGGRLQAVPVPGVGKLIAQYRNPQTVREIEAGMQVEYVGEDRVDGEPARVYAYATTKPTKSQAKAWISVTSGLPLQIESSGSAMGRSSVVRLRYQDWNDGTIHIDAP